MVINEELVTKMFNMVSSMFYYLENNYKIPGDEMFEAMLVEHSELQELMKPVVITSEMIWELRNTTGEGMHACKSALIKARGDMTKAKEYLR